MLGSTGLVVVGSDGSVAPACQGNTVTGPVILGWFGSASANIGGLVLDNNTLKAPVAVENNSDPSGGNTQIDANRVVGALLCGGNLPAPIDSGAANEVTGTSYSQCLGL